jgi:hypothetical protein
MPFGNTTAVVSVKHEISQFWPYRLYVLKSNMKLSALKGGEGWRGKQPPSSKHTAASELL